MINVVIRCAPSQLVDLLERYKLCVGNLPVLTIVQTPGSLSYT